MSKNILLLLVILISSCCSTPKRILPPSPELTVCSHDVELGIVFCSNAPPVEINATDTWIMFDLKNFRLLMDYVDKLRE